MCEQCDFLLIQEHWLLPSETSMLSTIHEDFLAIGHLTIDLTQRI